MNSSENLTKRVEKFSNDPKYSKFIEDLKKGRDWMYDIVMNYSEDKINIVTDSKDADGFGSQIILHKGLECILDFLGNYEVKIESTRIGRFSKNKDDPENLQILKEKMGHGKWIIADLATLDPDEANRTLEEMLFTDHHPHRKGFDKRFVTVNPDEHEIPGAKELSSAMNATLMINMLYDKIESDFKYTPDKKIRKKLNELREQLDYLSMFGISGSKADQQDDIGLNKPLYDYLSNRGLIEWIDSPFYGHTTKAAAKVWAQSTPFYNMKYEVPTKEDLNRIFTSTGLNLSKDRGKLIDELYDKFRWAFVYKKVETDDIENISKVKEINVPYLESLSIEEITELNELTTQLAGVNVVDYNPSSKNELEEIKVNEPFEESSFSNFIDNISDMDGRIRIANRNLSRMKYNGEEHINLQKGLVDKLKEEFRDNVIAFGDKEDLEFSLGKLKKGQYVCKSDLPMVDTSIAEIANKMTAMSKQDCGPLMLEAIDEVLDNTYTKKISLGRSKITQVDERHGLYRYMVAVGMEAVSKELVHRNEERFKKLKKDISFCDLTFMKPIVGEVVDLKKMNGVYAGLACETRLVPGGKGIFFTGVQETEIINGKEKKIIKISGRATDSPKYENAHINSLMMEYDGGGHRTAAACVIPFEKLEEFLARAKTFDYFGGR